MLETVHETETIIMKVYVVLKGMRSQVVSLREKEFKYLLASLNWIMMMMMSSLTVKLINFIL